MEDNSSSVITRGQLQVVLSQITEQNQQLKARVNATARQTLKMPRIKPFIDKKSKLKEFLTQIRIKIVNKGVRPVTKGDKVVYVGLYLAGKALEWFKPYLIEYQENGINTTNLEVKYIFLTWGGFVNRLT
jgi:hypothetical protein